MTRNMPVKHGKAFGIQIKPITANANFGNYKITDGSFSGTYGGLRDVVTGPDGDLFILTSNLDGRGKPRQGDDRILRLTRK